MMNNNYYVAMIKNGFDIDSVKARIRKDAMNEIEELLTDMLDDDDAELYEFLKDNDLGDGIHPMDELDDVFDYMSPTEVLEELSDMDLSDTWFNEYSKETSNSLEDLWNSSFHELARDIVNYDVEVDDEDVMDVLDDMNGLLNFIEEEGESIKHKIEQAKKLFEEAMKNDVDTLINVLWNMNA